MPFTYAYARPALTVDVAVFAFEEGVEQVELQVMLIERDLEPFAGSWALPGGFVRLDETIEEAARRELEEETGLRGLFLEQLQTFGATDRDPRERVVSVAHYALANLEGHGRPRHHRRPQRRLVPASTICRNWLSTTPTSSPPHSTACGGSSATSRSAFELLPEVFPLRRLQALYESVLGRPLDKRNFRKKILQMDVLADTGEIEKDVKHRAAKLYRFEPSGVRAALGAKASRSTCKSCEQRFAWSRRDGGHGEDRKQNHERSPPHRAC